jgi:hypothetical protein
MAGDSGTVVGAQPRKPRGGEGPLAPGIHRSGHWGAAAAATRLRKGTLPSAHWRPEDGAAELRPGRPDRQGQGRESQRQNRGGRAEDRTGAGGEGTGSGWGHHIGRWGQTGYKMYRQQFRLDCSTIYGDWV